MTCEYYNACAFMEHMRQKEPFTASSINMTYCEASKYNCSRYCLSQILRAEDVPDHLWPNDEEEAFEVIKRSIPKQKKG